ncbi:hypothetical protein GCM10018771_09220 [Streptomyces cellulosae]|nr:hypothetical protein GCM10018771_09220 [Streptomyces cellulosae]
MLTEPPPPVRRSGSRRATQFYGTTLTNKGAQLRLTDAGFVTFPKPMDGAGAGPP